MPTLPSRSSRSPAEHSNTLAAIAKTLSRTRSLAWWMAADRFTVERLAIVPNPIGIAAVSAKVRTTSSGRTFQQSAAISR
jgi:hypothetical protein